MKIKLSFECWMFYFSYGNLIHASTIQKCKVKFKMQNVRTFSSYHDRIQLLLDQLVEDSLDAGPVPLNGGGDGPDHGRLAQLLHSYTKLLNFNSFCGILNLPNSLYWKITNYDIFRETLRRYISWNPIMSANSASFNNHYGIMFFV